MSLLPTWGRLGCSLTHQSPLIRLSQEKTSGWSPPPLMSSLFSFTKFLPDHPDCTAPLQGHPSGFEIQQTTSSCFPFQNLLFIEANLYFQSPWTMSEEKSCWQDRASLCCVSSTIQRATHIRKSDQLEHSLTRRQLDRSIFLTSVSLFYNGLPIKTSYYHVALHRHC